MSDTGPTASQVQAINRLAERNMQKIDTLAETRKADHAEIMAALDRLSDAMFGNGEPKKGLSYRLSWQEEKMAGQERYSRWLTVAVSVTGLATLAIAAIMAIHLFA